MAEVKWTDDQLAAIETKGRNILVSAAAGSGKTAVLVERILRRIMNDKVNIDEMLIVTFTNAAAAEMKEKINRRLRAYEAKTEEEIRHKRRQLNSIADADISTIDSFCINCVRSNAHELDISRDFGICDEAMGEMIVDEAIEALFESYYNNEDEDFLRLTKKYCTQYSDVPLMSLIKRIYNFILDYENPMQKLDEIFALYKSGDMICSRDWAKDIMREQLAAAKELFARLDDGSVERAYYLLSGATGIEGQEKVADALRAVEAVMSVTNTNLDEMQCNTKNDWDTLNDIRRVIGAWKRPLKIALTYEEKKDEEYVNFKAECDSAIENIASVIYDVQKDGFNYVCMDYATLERQFEDICVSVTALKRMVTELSERVRKIKHHRNVFTFQDIEHLAYELLDNEETELALRYRMKYSDILIDEYQDTNALQDAIFRKISRDNKNIFMVGDLKQSIYAFRGGDPTIFKDKGARYGSYHSGGSEDGIRIDLSMNFRSNGEVVDAINSTFGFVMSEGVGDVDYNKQGEKLVCGRDRDGVSDEEKPHRKKPELVALPFIQKRGERESDGVSIIDHGVIEARYVAKRIREMVDNKELIFADGVVRPIEYRDITIIGSSIRGVASLYNNEFKKADIPLALPVMGYYENYEVIVMISLLRLLVNRRLDIPLVTVMRSPIGGFTDDELSDMSYGDGRTPLYERLLKACNASRVHIEGDTPEAINAAYSRAAERESRLRRIRQKARRFVAMLDRFEGYKRYKGVATIIYDIYTETRFFDFAGALENGEMAQQNLTLLYEKAKQFSQMGGNNLYGFVKYMEKVSSDAENEKGMSLINEEQNVVRMMTIHGSKGLEFPVVFAIGLGKDFRKAESDEGIIERVAGIGLRYRDGEEKSYSEFPLYGWVKKQILRESRSEEMRKLYVLMTRARERLICVMSKRFDSEVKFMAMRDEQKLYGDLLTELKNVRDAQRENGERELIQLVGIEDAKGFYSWILSAYDAEGDSWEYVRVENDEISCLYDSNVLDVLESEYRYGEMAALPSKTTVSKVKANEKEKDSTFEMRYAFSLDVPKKGKSEKKLSAGVLGTAYHQVMAFIVPKSDMSIDEARDEILRVAQMGEIPYEAAKEIKPEKISAFYGSGTVGEKVVDAYEKGLLHRETPFEIHITPDVYNKELNEKAFTQSDKILLQGTIDCWFENEQGECTVIDYKTDRIGEKDEKEFKKEKLEEYRVQLDLYSKAINKLEGKKVVKRYLYLFAIDEFVEVKKKEGE